MPGNAAIYIADPSLLMCPRFFETLEGIQSYEGINEGDAAVGIRFTLDAGQVEMNFLSKEKMSRHLEDLAGFAQNVIKDSNLLRYVQARIHYVHLVCGCVITLRALTELTREGRIVERVEAGRITVRLAEVH